MIIYRSKLDMEEPSERYSEREQLQWERELLGLFLSQNPIHEYENYLQQHATPIRLLTEAGNNDQVIIGGSVVAIREITTKNNQKMAFMSIEDKTGDIEVVIFPRIYKKDAKLWDRDRVLIIAGNVSH